MCNFLNQYINKTYTVGDSIILDLTATIKEKNKKKKRSTSQHLKQLNCGTKINGLFGTDNFG